MIISTTQPPSNFKRYPAIYYLDSNLAPVLSNNHGIIESPIIEFPPRLLFSPPDTVIHVTEFLHLAPGYKYSARQI